jgi:hypothetical protein
MAAFDEAQSALNELFARSMERARLITSLRRVAEVALPLSVPVLEREDAAFLRTLAMDESWVGLLAKPAEFLSKEAPAALAPMMVQRTVEAARSVMDAACLVFAHAGLDDAALECCRITMLVVPEEWDKELLTSKVALQRVRDSSYEGLAREAREQRLAELARESLLRKIALVFKRCPPPKGWNPFTDGTRYDDERVRRLDSLRHRLVHGPFINAVDSADDDVWFLLRVPYFLCLLVNRRFRLGLVPERVIGAIRS